MEHLINSQVQSIELSGIRQFFNLVANMEGMISFSIGQPDFPTPEEVKAAGISAIQNNDTTYTHNAGYLDLRNKAVDYFCDKYQLNYSPDEIIVTSGASQAIDASFRTILSPGTEVVLPGPVYPGYEPLIRLCEATPVYVDTSKHSFKLTASLIEKSLTEKTRCVVLPYPSNPTGVSLSRQELIDIADLLKGRDIFILADEIYSTLSYDTAHVSIASFLKEQTIVINGLSKSHSMTGWRIGFVLAPEKITKHILKVHQYNVSCASSISQKAALKALSSNQADSHQMRNTYRLRRDYVYQRLIDMELETILPDGAFYFFVKIPAFLELNSLQFSLQLAREAKVAVVPGSAFPQYGEGYFRLSFACSMESLEEGLNRLHDFLNKLKQ
ncbi:aminotransferase A [Bacillus sp. 2205SS5-2]|uniref:aminotransferase A n=1 Tax=Bacillus sp. 2205SS5-2 TaxID=3109031 RepID=UPI0030079842